MANGDHVGDRELTCFVLIGFGRKTDFPTGRVLDLDLTYSNLIKPAFDAVGIRCFRAIDINVAGGIDRLMYEWLYRADFVVADLSTMNPNVFYELGVRHALRPATTIIMAENGAIAKLPFDLSHMIIYGYEHLGDEIADAEVARFTKLMENQLKRLIESPDGLLDSPVYTSLSGLLAPTWEASDGFASLEGLVEKLNAEAEEFLARALSDEPLDAAKPRSQPLAVLIEAAQTSLLRSDYSTAKTLFRTAIDNARTAAAGEMGPPDIDECQPEAAVDVFLWQRLALVVYKEAEALDDERAIAALKEADLILTCKCDSITSTDPETLGLSGAVNKRLYGRTGERRYFERAAAYLERAFDIKQDYYNGNNAAYMHLVEAVRLAEAGERYEAMAHYSHATAIYQKVADICEAMIADTDAFAHRGDKEWVVLTLLEAYTARHESYKAAALELEIERFGEFVKEVWKEQKQRLENALVAFESATDGLDDTAAMEDVSSAKRKSKRSRSGRGKKRPQEQVPTLAMSLPATETKVTRQIEPDADEQRDPGVGATPAATARPRAGDSPRVSDRTEEPRSGGSPASGTQPVRDRVFVSYSHADGEIWFDRFETPFKTLQRTLGVRFWSDRNIKPSQIWDEEIMKAVRETAVAVLLVTPGFISSEYIDSKELPPILEAWRRKEVAVIWVHAIPALIEVIPEFEIMQCAHTPENVALDSLEPPAQNIKLAEISRVVADAIRERVPRRVSSAAPF